MKFQALLFACLVGIAAVCVGQPAMAVNMTDVLNILSFGSPSAPQGFCNIQMKLHKFDHNLEVSSCTFSDTTVKLIINMGIQDATNYCDFQPTFLQEHKPNLYRGLKGWTLQIWNPYSTGPLASCSLH